MRKILFLFLIVFTGSSILCSKNMRALRSSNKLDENRALEKLADEIYNKSNILKDKKLAVFNFSNLDGKETDEGKRLSKKLLEKLLKKGDLRFIERSEINKILKAQGFEQTGIVDPDSIAETGKVLPIDIMISGTIAQLKRYGELTIKAVNISTGEIYLVSAVNFYPEDNFSYKENPDKLKLHRKNPDKIDAINKTFRILKVLNKKRPLIFLLAVIDRNDIKKIRDENPRLARKMNRVKKIAKRRNPRRWQRLIRLRKGVKLIKKFDSEKNDILMKKKTEILDRMTSG